MKSLITVLMRRDKLTKEEAEGQIEEAKEEFYHRLDNNEDAYNVLEDMLGLESDYIMELF